MVYFENSLQYGSGCFGGWEGAMEFVKNEGLFCLFVLFCLDVCKQN